MELMFSSVRHRYVDDIIPIGRHEINTIIVDHLLTLIPHTQLKVHPPTTTNSHHQPKKNTYCLLCRLHLARASIPHTFSQPASILEGFYSLLQNSSFASIVIQIYIENSSSLIQHKRYIKGTSSFSHNIHHIIKHRTRQSGNDFLNISSTQKQYGTFSERSLISF